MKGRGSLYLSILSGWLLLMFCTLNNTWAAEEELQIGVPDLPRRIGRTLPAFETDRGVKLGEFAKLHPIFVSEVEYDDNIRLSDTDDKEDVIFTQSPGLVLESEFGGHRLEMGYGMEIVTFAKEQEEDATNHMAHGLLELNFNDLQIRVQDLFEKSTKRTFNETSERDKLLINTVDLLARYDRPKWAVEFNWRHNTIDHRTASLSSNDYEEDVLAILAGYKILSKTLLLIETDVGTVNYRTTGNANQDYWQIFGGVRGEPTEEITLTAKIGFQDRQLGDVPGQGPQTDFDGLVALADFIFSPTEEDSFRLGYTRTVKTSTFADNSWYGQDRIFASYRKRLLRKWLVTPLFSWQFNDYPEEATAQGITKRREDSFWQASLALRYEIQDWLSTGIAYKFRSRNSNFDPFDFENNRILFDVTLIY